MTPTQADYDKLFYEILAEMTPERWAAVCQPVRLTPAAFDYREVERKADRDEMRLQWLEAQAYLIPDTTDLLRVANW